MSDKLQFVVEWRELLGPDSCVNDKLKLVGHQTGVQFSHRPRLGMIYTRAFHENYRKTPAG